MDSAPLLTRIRVSWLSWAPLPGTHHPLRFCEPCVASRISNRIAENCEDDLGRTRKCREAERTRGTLIPVHRTPRNRYSCAFFWNGSFSAMCSVFNLYISCLKFVLTFALDTETGPSLYSAEIRFLEEVGDGLEAAVSLDVSSRPCTNR